MSSQDPSAQRPARPTAPGDPSGPAVRYRERLTAAWWMWLVVAFVGGTAFVALAPIDLADDALETYRADHPLARVMPLVREVLGAIAHDGAHLPKNVQRSKHQERDPKANLM